MTNTKKKPKTLYPTPRILEMVKEIKEKRGLTTDSDVYFYAIGETHAMLFKDYLVKRGSAFDSDDIEKNAKRKVEFREAEKKHKRDMHLAEKKNICTLILRGNVVGEECHFDNYDYGKVEAQVIPLDAVTEEMAHNQFYPDRETVFKELPEIAKKYEND